MIHGVGVLRKRNKRMIQYGLYDEHTQMARFFKNGVTLIKYNFSD